ncbi:hypothetical protein GCM10009799_37440 [Nocardiopsis rhodophaea]|uniref:Uncharacterized protein n=1 Tax=Nocardiopsis rhodophaea TaxID=280238 RepID=A0ABP5ESI0_9ACTN
MTTYFEVHQAATMTELREWATTHDVALTRGGYTLDGHVIYSATCGPVTIVVVSSERDPGPIVWRSPFE